MDNMELKLLEKLPLCDDRCCGYFIKLLWLLLLLYAFHQYYYYQLEFTQWDLLLFSGVAVLILGLHIAGRIPQRFRELIARLENRQVLGLGTMTREDLFEEVRKKGDSWARIIGLIAALGIALAFMDALNKDFYWPRVFLGIGEIIGGYIAGNYLGRMAAYGQLGLLLKSLNLTVTVDPTHVDGVGGLKPVGDFFFFQAMVVAIPAIFLAVWWFLFPMWPRDYTHWEQSYLGLMAIALSIEIIAFLLPLWSFHKIMDEQKQVLQSKADEISNEIAQLQQAIDCSDSEDEKKNKLALIEDKTQRYWLIENMLTWPVDLRTRHKFKVNNILLLLPLVGDIAKRNVDFSKLIEVMKQLAV